MDTTHIFLLSVIALFLVSAVAYRVKTFQRRMDRRQERFAKRDDGSLRLSLKERDSNLIPVRAEVIVACKTHTGSAMCDYCWGPAAMDIAYVMVRREIMDGLLGRLITDADAIASGVERRIGETVETGDCAVEVLVDFSPDFLSMPF